MRVATLMVLAGCASELTAPTATSPAPLVSAEVDPAEQVSGQPTSGRVEQTQWSVRSAGVSSGGLIAWFEHRSGHQDIWAARVDSTGAVLDPNGIPISITPMQHNTLAVAASPSGYLVVWDQTFNAGVYSVRAARVQLDGTVLDPVGITLFADAGFGVQWPAAAFDGTRWVVAAVRSPGGVHLQRLGATGNLVDPVPRLIGGSPYGAPGVASAGGMSLVAWQDARTAGTALVYAARVDGAGMVLDPNGVRLCAACAGPQTEVAAAGGAAEWLVTWNENSVVPARVGYAVLPTASLPADTLKLLPGDAVSGFAYPAAAFDGSRFVIGWLRQSQPTAMVARIERDGGLVDPAGFTAYASSRSLTSPALLGVNTTTLMSFTDSTSGRAQVTGTRLAGGVALDSPPTRLSGSGLGQLQVAVARSDAGAMVVWSEHRAGARLDVRGSRLDTAGRALDVPPIPLAVSTDDESEPAIGFDGTAWLIAWTRRPAASGPAQIEGARVSVAGAVLRSYAYGVNSNAGSLPAVAASPQGSLVVWTQYRDATFTNDLAFTRVTSSGTLLDQPPRYLAAAMGNQQGVRAAFDGARFLVAWEELGVDFGVRAARIELDAGLPDGLGLLLTDAGSARAPDVAARPGEFLVTWFRTPLAPPALMVSRVSTSGALLDGPGVPVAVPAVADPDSRPAAAWDGQRFQLVWADTRDGGQPALYATSLVGTTPQAEEALGPGTEPALAAGPEGWGVLAYDRIDLTPVVMARRARTRLFGPRPPGAPCSANECLPGLSCVAATCCSPGSCADAGSFDAGIDAGVADGGVDAGPGDGGAPPADGGAADAGAPDGGGVEPADAGPQPVRRFAVGCSSGAGGRSSALWLLVVLARRRSSRRS